MTRKKDPVVLVEREGSASVVWFLVGGAVGAGLALLFAPSSGDHTRRVLGRRLTKLRDAADQTLSDLKDAIAGEGRARGTSRQDDGAEEEGELPGEVEDEPPEPAPRRGVAAARRELEQRLAEARARRRRAIPDEDEEPVA